MPSQGAAVVMEAVTAGVAAAVIMAEGTMVVVTVTATISAAGIMAAAIFMAERRISVHSPHIVRFPRNA